MYYIGLDIHKKTISYCIKQCGGEVHVAGSGERHPSSAGRVVEDAATAVERRDGSHAVHRLDLRSPVAACGISQGGSSIDAARHRCIQEEERPRGCEQDRGFVALRFAAGVLHGSGRDAGTAAHAAVPQSAGAAECADEEQAGAGC